MTQLTLPWGEFVGYRLTSDLGAAGLPDDDALTAADITAGRTTPTHQPPPEDPYQLPELPPPLGAWRSHAACAGTTTTLFFPAERRDAPDARRICADCPVRHPCGEYAVEHNIRHGIWGGMSERERRRIRQERRNPRSPAA